MILVAFSMAAAAAVAPPQSPPQMITSFLSAVASGDLRAARAALSADAVIIDERRTPPAHATLEAFAGHVQGCARTDLSSDVDPDDPARAAFTVTWTCPSRAGAQAFIWTDRTGLVFVQFGEAPPQ